MKLENKVIKQIKKGDLRSLSFLGINEYFYCFFQTEK